VSRGAFSVALVGVDGAGKSTLASRLPDALPFEAASVYMGVNLRASTLMLPTTRLLLWMKVRLGGKSDLTGYSVPASRDSRGTPAARLRETVRVLNLIAEEWFRQLVAWLYMKRGQVVIFDRHPLVDYYFHDMQPGSDRRSAIRRLHGFSLGHLPRPDLILYLEAPVEVLLDRKPESDKTWLEDRISEYRNLVNLLPGFTVVDATQSADDVLREVVDLIVEFARTQR
jgi:thymidylate kinase